MGILRRKATSLMTKFKSFDEAIAKYLNGNLSLQDFINESQAHGLRKATISYDPNGTCTMKFSGYISKIGETTQTKDRAYIKRIEDLFSSLKKAGIKVDIQGLEFRR